MSYNPRKANGHRREQVKDAVFSEETHCWLCGKPVNMELRGVLAVNPTTGKVALHPDAPVVDEVIPTSRGGSCIQRSNCRLAHNRCNLHRGNRMDIDKVRAELQGKATKKVHKRPVQSGNF